MKLTVYTECPTEVYYQPLRYLAKEGKIKLDVIDSRFLYLTFLKLRSLITGKRVEHITGSVLGGLIAPLKLFFSKKILVAFGPYGSMVYYLLLLKLIGKDLLYYTSWPDWGRNRGKHNNFLNRFAWRLFLKNTKVVGVNHASSRKLNNVKVIPHIVNSELFKPEKKKLNVLYVGRMEKEKGILDLLKLSKEFRDITFTFVGNGKLKDKVNGENVQYLGEIWNREHLSKIFNQSSIYVLNSYTTKKWEEVFGLSALEAMCAGLAVIATNSTGPSEFINDGENGFLIPQRDINALREKLKMLIKDKKLREKLGRNGRKTAIEKYNMERISNLWLEAVQQ
tara:strand:- start:322 stop:1332 length:1011 start_codon:yes stop_codon:yes gene_type:complete